MMMLFVFGGGRGRVFGEDVFQLLLIDVADLFELAFRGSGSDSDFILLVFLELLLEVSLNFLVLVLLFVHLSR